jgi:hypothetical protein
MDASLLAKSNGDISAASVRASYTSLSSATKRHVPGQPVGQAELQEASGGPIRRGELDVSRQSDGTCPGRPEMLLRSKKCFEASVRRSKQRVFQRQPGASWRLRPNQGQPSASAEPVLYRRSGISDAKPETVTDCMRRPASGLAFRSVRMDMPDRRLTKVLFSACLGDGILLPV